MKRRHRSKPGTLPPRGVVAKGDYVTTLAGVRQRAWLGDINRTAEELAGSGKTPARFNGSLPTKELKRICRKNGLSTANVGWLRTTALTLFLAYQRRQPAAMAVIRKELKDLIERFERLNEAIDHLHIENEWQIDVYVEEIDAQTNEITFYRTANPPLELLKRYLDELLERTRSVKLPESESGRRKALPTLAMELLASHLREAKPDASRHDLAQLAEDLLDPILPKTVIPPLWHQRARDCWPDSTSTRVKST